MGSSPEHRIAAIIGGSTQMAYARVVLFAVICVAVLIMCTGFTQVAIFDCAFATAQYRFRFIRSDGTPVKGVRLDIEDSSGNAAFYYPVSDYTQDNSLESDSQGLLVFHHVSLGVEYSRSVRYFFGFIREQENSDTLPTRFLCRFSRRGTDVFVVSFNQLDTEVNVSPRLPSTTVRWKWPSTIYDHLPLRLQPEQPEQTVSFPIVSKEVVIDE
jgi:hypothetical protein